MTRYIVTITCERYKILLIKMVRTINNWGLKTSKDYVEENFSFGEWMTDDVTFNITIFEDQFGRLAHFVNKQSRDCRIITSEVINTPEPDPYDFTK